MPYLAVGETMPCVTVETLSGESKMVDLSSLTTLGDLRGAIGRELDVPAKHLQLAVGPLLLPHDESVMLEAAGVEDGARVSAIVRQCPPLPAIPSVFEVKLQSSRMRLGSNRNSSAFTMVYTIGLDVPKSHVQASVMRKNDTDHLEFDGQKGCWKGDRGHWMAGTTPIEEQPLACFHLGDVLRDWMDSAEVVFDSEKQLWSMPIDGALKKGELGWFVAPSSDCFELYVNAPFPVRAPHDSLRIARVLVDASGNPVRAALYHENAKNNVPPKDHLEKADVNDMSRDGNFLLEEFDVSLILKRKVQS